MRNVMDSVLKSLKNFFTKLTKTEKIRLAVIAIVILVLSIIITTVMGRTQYGVLYSGLSESDAGDILTALESLGVETETQGSGTILVPEERISELRMKLSADGYQSGDFDYSIFQNATGFGTTDLEKQTYLQFQLQANLRDYILKMDRIEDCMVIINMPKESSYVLSSNESPASASVLVEVKGGGNLTDSEANAIAETISMSIPGLKTENIRIVDSNMHLYSIGEEAIGNSSSNVDKQFELESQLQEELELQVVNLLTPVYGSQYIKAAASVTLNFDNEVVTSVEFTPPVEGETEGIVVSMSELYENSRTGAAAEGVAGTDSNGLGTVEYPYSLDDDELYSKVVKEANYEINETTTQIEKAKGTVKDLTIAILIDSETISEDYTDNVRNLVANAIGVNEDYISVERLPFQNTESQIDTQLAEQQAFINSIKTKEFLIDALKYAVILIIVLLAFSFIKTIINIVAGRQPERAVLASGGTIDYIADDTRDDVFDYKDIDLNSKTQGVAQLEKFIDKDPEAVAQLLRNWLSDE